MKITVIRGSIKYNDKVYPMGESLELDEKQALSIIHSGIAEEYVQPVAQEPKEEEVKEIEKVEEVKKEVVVNEVEPSLDWTRAELDAFAKERGVEYPEKAGSKKAVLKLIAEVQDDKTNQKN